MSATPRTDTLRLTGGGCARCAAEPLRYRRYTNPQRAFLSFAARLALWRAANQIGKSQALADDIIYTATGLHPFRETARPPVRLMVVSESWAQMDPLCEKLWNALPKGDIHKKVKYVPGQGIQGFKERVIPFMRGPGAGSVIHLATYQQGAKRLAGPALHGVYLDEPPPETVYGEIQPRLSKFHGFMRVTMTPTPESPPLEYLRELVEKKIVREIQTSLSLDAITLRGGRFEFPWKTPAELQELIDSYLEVERGMRVHGEWEPIAAGRWLTNWSDELVDVRLLPSGAGCWIAMGIDHGVKAGRQYAGLVACAADGTRIGLLDEVLSDGRTSTADDAKAILEMLARNGLTWEMVDYWIGDRSHGGDYFGAEKSNSDLLYEFSRLLKLPKYQLQDKGLRINTPRKLRGSVTRGIRLMNSLCKYAQFGVHPRCKGFIEAAKNWEGRKDDPLKDRLDGVRYPIEVLYDRNVLHPVIPAIGRIF